MKKQLRLLKMVTAVVGAIAFSNVSAQCPVITCPANITVNAAPGTCGAVVTYTAPVGTNACPYVAQTFNYTGSSQTFTVPAGVTSINVDLAGGGGGYNSQGNQVNYGQHVPGLGGRITGTLAVTPGQVYTIFVGNKGGDGGNYVAGAGGYNGGGSGNTYYGSYNGGGGGGATDIRFGGVALANRVFVAGGGGGAAYNYSNGDDGGNGGGLIGANGESNNNAGGGLGGVGGSQVAGGARGNYYGSYYGNPGALGVGGGANGSYPSSGGGGGAGYYGGGSGAWTGGGGGSNYATPSATNVVHTQGFGFAPSPGSAIISYSPPPPTTTRTAGLASGSTFPVGNNVVTYTVNDGLGNLASCSFSVIVVDNQMPVITAPSNITVNNDPGMCGAVVTFNTPVGTDNCVVTTAQTAGLPSGSLFPVGVTTETFTATDASGNATSATFTITVTDVDAPMITAPANITVSNDAGVCGAVVNFNAPVGTDNCVSTTTLTAGLANGSLFPVGTTTETYTVTDASGNNASASFTVTVTDNEMPVVTVPANVSTCNPVVNGIGPVATDNCSVSGITYTLTGATTGNGNNDASGSTFNVGTTTVTYNAMDAGGNMGMASLSVTVHPTFNTPASASICQGDAILLGGAMQTQAGTYTDHLFSVFGCDSIISTTLTVNPLPTVTLSAFADDSLCTTEAPVALPSGIPGGGTYSGLGVVGSTFSPSVAGIGQHYVKYTYVKPGDGCTNSDSTLVTVYVCPSGIADMGSKLQPSVSPNPTNGQIVINLGATYKAVEVSVLEINGRSVITNKYNYTSTITNDLSGLATGMYFLQIKADGQTTMVKVTKN